MPSSPADLGCDVSPARGGGEALTKASRNLPASIPEGGIRTHDQGNCVPPCPPGYWQS